MQSIYTQKNGEHLSWPKAFLPFLLGRAPLETDSETDSEQNQSTRAKPEPPEGAREYRAGHYLVE